MNKQQLASKIWQSANTMRSKIEANEYKDYILGFIFYKFLSEQEVQFVQRDGMTAEDLPGLTESDEEIVRYLRNHLGYFIAYDDLFSTWLAKGKDFNVGDVRTALSAFNRNISSSHKGVFEGIFRTLETGLSKLGQDANSQTKAIRDLIQLIRDIPMNGKQDYDTLGFIYEYLIEKFASNAGKKAGEFYTPHEVSQLMSEIVADHLRDCTEVKIYDPTSGSGSLLITIGAAMSRRLGDPDAVKYYAQEYKENTYNLTRMNLVMRGIKPGNIVARNGDTLASDWPYFDDSDPAGTYDPLYVDAVVSNPPYSQNWDADDAAIDPRFSEFGVAPKSKADYAFLLHDLFHLQPHGIMTIVLPHGVLFRGDAEGTIRRNLIERGHIHAIIGLPANIFYGTGIPTIIMVLRKNRPETDVLIVDASKHFGKEGKNNKLRSGDIKHIVDVVRERRTEEKYSRLVSLDEIRANDYNLNIPRYVDSSEEPESWDIYASMFGGVPQQELQKLNRYWRAFPGLKEALFDRANEPYASPRTDAPAREIALAHASVQAFKQSFADAFSDFGIYLYEELIEEMGTLLVKTEEEAIADELFGRLDHIALVDRYEAYQVLDDHWRGISEDLEVIQSEGVAAIRAVDPRMVIKKKSGSPDVEVQDGWKGRILPFDLVQHALMADELAELERREMRLSAISQELDDVANEFPEEDREGDYFNDDGGALVGGAVKKALKTAERGSDKHRLLAQANALFEEEKRLKREVKERTADLQAHTKETIEGLSTEQAYELLSVKWIDALLADLMVLPDGVADALVVRVEALDKKYSVTYADVTRQIHETEQSLISMLDELTGSEYDMQGIAEFKQLLGGK
jgi:type I restriction enzyme M protein